MHTYEEDGLKVEFERCDLDPTSQVSYPKFDIIGKVNDVAVAGHYHLELGGRDAESKMEPAAVIAELDLEYGIQMAIFSSDAYKAAMARYEESAR